MRKGNDLISIIVPIYNVEKYLKRCINSVLNQSYKNIEIILINDGSPDNCPKIIDEYEKKYKNISAYHKENGGLSSARNYGLEKSNGKYVCFIDSDDYISERYIELLYKKIKEENADISVCNYYRVYNTQNKKCIAGKFKTEYFITPAAWNKLYRKELFDGIYYPEGKYYEDLGTTPKLIMKSQKISYVDDYLYYYYQNSSSIMKSVNQKIYDIYDIMDDIINYSKKNNYYDNNKEKIELASIFHILIGTSYRLSNSKNFNKNTLINIERKVKEYFPKYYNNRAIKNLSLEYKIFVKLYKYKMYYLILLCLKIINITNYRYK